MFTDFDRTAMARALELAARGLDRARALYAWPVVARRAMDFFDSLVGTKAA